MSKNRIKSVELLDPFYLQECMIQARRLGEHADDRLDELIFKRVEIQPREVNDLWKNS